MPTETLPMGAPFLMKANVVYALPACNVTLFTDAAAPTITLSNTSAFTANASVTLTGGASQVVGGFVKAAADALVTLKRD